MNSSVKNYQDLEVWKQGIELVKEIYKLTQSYPKSELYGLTSQIRRATVSIPANIAEGQARSGTREFLQFLNIALGSIAELETLVIISRDLEYMAQEQSQSIQEQCRSLTRQLHALVNTLKNKSS